MVSALDLLDELDKPKSALSLLEPSEPSYTFKPYKESQPYLGQVSEAEKKYGLPSNLLANVIHAESRFNPKAVSLKGATGIAQIMPGFHPDVDPTDPAASIDYSAKYLKQLHGQFGAWDKALAAYNTGPGNLEKFGMENLPKETQAYVEGIQAQATGGGVDIFKAKSALDLLDQLDEPAEVREPVVEDLSLTPNEQMSLSRAKLRGVGAGTIQGALLSETMNLSVDEFDRTKTSPILTQKMQEDFMETISGYGKLAQQPMEIIRGGAQFLLSLPGFALGVMGAAQKMGERAIGAPFNMEDLYEAATSGMEELSTYWHDKMVEPLLGTPPPEASLVGQTIMAPALAISMVGGKLADQFPNHPNISGFIRFAGDIGGLAALGRIFKGSSKKTSAKAEEITHKAAAIVESEKLIEGIVDQKVKAAQQRVLESKKQQLELEAADVAKKLDFSRMIKEDLTSKGRLAKKARQPKRAILDDQIDKAMQKIKAPSIIERHFGTKAEILESFKAVETEGEVSADLNLIANLEKEFGKKIDKISDKEVEQFFLDREEGITELDMQTGTRTPVELDTDHSPFRDSPEKTLVQKVNFEEHAKGVSESLELYTGKLLNDVNRWLDGEAIDIDATRNALSELSARAEQVKHEHFADGETYPNNWLDWKEVVEGGAEWARKADRSKIERTGLPTEETLSIIDTDPGTNTLYSGIDPFEVGKQARKIIKSWSRDANEVLQNAINLMLDGKVDMDVNYSTGVFWRDIPEALRPKRKVDKFPQTKDTIKADISKRIPADDVSLNSIVSDPPYLVYSGKSIPVIAKRFGFFKSLNDLLAYHDGAMGEFARVLKPGGRVIIKLQDISKATGERAKTIAKAGYEKARIADVPVTDYVKRFGVKHGLRYISEFVYVNKGGQLAHKEGVQRIPRKAHTTFLVFEKTQRKPLKETPLLDKYGIGLKLYSGIPLDQILSDAGFFAREIKEGVSKAKQKLAREGKVFSGSQLIDVTMDMIKAKQTELDTFLDIRSRAKAEIAEEGPVYADTASKYLGSDARTAESKGAFIRKLDDMITDRQWGVDRFKRQFARAQGKDLPADPATTGMKLNSGIPLDDAAKSLVDGARKLSAYTRQARSLKAFKPRIAATMLKESFLRNFVDKSGNIRRDLLSTLGDEGYRIIQKMYLSKGASSLSANMLNQMRKEVYNGLTRNEKRVLDNLILADRMIDIGSYKTAKQFKFPDAIKPENSIAYSELFEFVERLTPERASEIRRRAESYFEWMKKPLKDMLDADLITADEYDLLIAHNYRRVKLVDIFDKRYSAKIGKRKRTVYDSGVESLARGRDTDIFEPSSEVMALEVFNRAYGRILNNQANKSLLELAKAHPENPFARIRSKDHKIPSGWNRIFAFEGGERTAIYLSPKMSKEWITNNPEMSYQLGQIIRFASLSPVLRTFATGINWGFAIANLPRDIMHTWFAARTFQDGKWKSIYSPHAPVFAFQMARDMTSVFIDAAKKGPKTKKYIEEGGGMEFLVHQGRLFQRGRHLEGPIDKVYDFFGYFGETSELIPRLAIKERVMRKRGKEQGMKLEEARKNEEISREGTFAARDYMDFGQGGGVSKAADNGIPYLNAAIVGTRGMLRAFKDSPLESTYKLSQFAAAVTGIYIAGRKMHPKTMEALQGNIDMQNNLVLPLGDKFGFEDEHGQMRYPYVKIPLDPSQKFFKTFFEAATDKWLGNPVDINRVVDALKEQSPVGVTELPPTLSAALGYVTNKDFWLNEDIWKKTDKPFSYPQSKEEYFPGRTPQAYVDFGAVTGLSPERTRFAVEELVTSGTLWSFLLGQGYDQLFGDQPKDMSEKHLAMVLARTPVIKRFFGVTNPYSQFAGPIDKAKEESDIERWIQNRGLDWRVEGYLYQKNVERKEIFEYIDSFKDRDASKRLIERFKYQEVIKDLPNRAFWLRLKGLTVEARARVYSERLERATPEESTQMREELGIIIQAGGVVSKEFRKEVMKLQSEVQ